MSSGRSSGRTGGGLGTSGPSPALFPPWSPPDSSFTAACELGPASAERRTPASGEGEGVRECRTRPSPFSFFTAPAAKVDFL